MNIWCRYTVDFRKFGRCAFVAFCERLIITASLDCDLWYLARKKVAWYSRTDRTTRYTGDGEHSGDLVSGSKSGSCGQFRGNCQPERVIDPGKYFRSGLLPFTVKAGRGVSTRRVEIRRDLSWGYTFVASFVGFGCGDIDIGKSDVSRSARSGAWSGAMRGVALLAAL